MDFMGSCAFLVELIVMSFGKRNGPSLFSCLMVGARCAVSWLWKEQDQSGSQSAEMQPKHKDVLPMCSRFTLRPLRTSRQAKICSSSCLKYTDSCLYGSQLELLTWKEKKQLRCSLQVFKEQCSCRLTETKQIKTQHWLSVWFMPVLSHLLPYLISQQWQIYPLTYQSYKTFMLNQWNKPQWRVNKFTLYRLLSKDSLVEIW